ncbi:MAG: hypothetical protein ACOX7B_03190 [Christensenellales bacterium]|jgi:hypothetical protein
MSKSSRTANRTLALLRGQMGAWLRSPRTPVLLLLLIIYAATMASTYGRNISQQFGQVYFGETVFFYLGRGFTNSLSVLSAVMLLLLSEVPRRTALQNYLLIRSSRTRWLWSLILFCAVSLLMMLMLLLIVHMAFTLPHLSMGSGWSDPQRIEAADDPYLVRLIPEVVTSSGLTPFIASLLALDVLFLYWMMFLMLILLCSLLGAPNLGVMIYFTLFFLHVTVMWEFVPWLFVPAKISTMLTIMNTTQQGDALPAVYRALATMGGIVITLIGAMFFVIQKTELRFSGRN